ncbi:hypothetical protein ONZ43_g7503 [Nemania bipapillata]|uniref:Uncharacterized protein n=1 Tax=Nemania bipapillata TaxID=110536 RepID=A0ACC2HR90_9PEZI|nr:hypothetical protein ONZ43_g7503 [Nemania bipapillata]
MATPRVTFIGSYPNPEGHHIPRPSSGGPEVVDIQAPRREKDDEMHEAQLRAKYQAEFNKKFEIEKEFERERRNERMAIMEGLKQQVEAIRREAVDQAERKIRVEAQERAQQQGWEKRMEDRKQETEIALAKAIAVAEAESAAKIEATKRAIEEEKRKMKEEYEMVKKKEKETQQQLEREIRDSIEAGRRAYEEVEAAERLKEEQLRKAEVERKEKQEADARDLEAAMRLAEEENTRKWAAEEVRKDQEVLNQIHLKDALGRKYKIPFAIGRTWQGMEQFIEAAFLHIDIVGPEVRAGHYDLIGPDGAIILPQIWDLMVQPGWNVSMHMWPRPQSLRRQPLPVSLRAARLARSP